VTVKPHALFVALLPIALGAGCFHQTGPEDASPVAVPALVSIRIEYRQPYGCLNVASPCDGPVTFFGSWMPQGTQIVLSQVSAFVWTGTATGVPVNFPPVDQPYLVRVYDPFLRDYPTGGATADRLQVGGQALTQFYEHGTFAEFGLIYIDATGVGHSPF
jgi:hypothetical protein